SETFSVNLSTAVNATIFRAAGQVLIRDYNSLPVLQIAGPASMMKGNSARTTAGPSSMTEGDSAWTSVTFTVTLSAPSSTPVAVSYSTVNGTAVASADFIATSGVLTFAPGTTARTIAVAVVGDTYDETNETFSVMLSAPSGAALDIAQAQ